MEVRKRRWEGGRERCRKEGEGNVGRRKVE